ncbi:carboxylate--amine ligase [Cellulomonas sp. P22]|uniref:carboxylate--amine ligase n=1 Tax=Cellulomonas sp. P22 TaxID=3373189 RepID=UPI0037A26B3A
MQARAVVLGGDVGGYSLARAFHEAYGGRTIVVSTVPTVPLRYSRIVENVVASRMDEPEEVLGVLQEIADRNPDRALLLLGTADWHVRTIAALRDRLPAAYVVPYVEMHVLDRVTSKVAFAALCAEHGVDHPTTVVHDVRGLVMPDTSGLQFPVVAKPEDATGYHRVDFPGKRKVYPDVADEAELHALLAQVRDAGYTGSFLIQDRIPGDDTGMRVLTTYSDRSGRVRFASFGHVLLEEHTPGALGNPVGIITDRDDAVVAQAVRLLEVIGWTGFANFDLKYDPRDGRTVFFELNPRLGRSHAYVTASGHNTAQMYVREYVEGLDPLDGPDVWAQEQHLTSLVPATVLLRYLPSTLRALVRRLIRRGRASNPLWYHAERDPRRWAVVALAQANHLRKFRQHHPSHA